LQLPSFVLSLFSRVESEQIEIALELKLSPRARKLKFSIKNKNSFRNGSRPRAGWPMRLVLVQATPRAEVHVIGVQRCELASFLDKIAPSF